MKDSKKILIVDDEESIRFSLSKYLKDSGFMPYTARSPIEARSLVQTHGFAVAIVDRILAGGENGVELLRQLKEKQPFCQRVLISGYPSFESAAEAISIKVFSYLAKPVRKDQILPVVEQAVDQYRNRLAASLKGQIFSHIFDTSDDAIAVYDPSGLAVFVNEAFTDIFGHRPWEALGNTVPAIPESERLRAEQKCQQLRENGGPVEYETVRTTKAGRFLPLSLSLAEIAGGSGICPHVLAIYHPVKDADNKPTRGGQQRDQKQISKTMLLEVAHDFNNVLTIQGYRPGFTR
jgi:PAS domain S-box-containing protein